MNEIYRSFKGKLNVDNQEGVIVSINENGEWLQIETLSVQHEKRDGKMMVKASDKYNAQSQWSQELAWAAIYDVSTGAAEGFDATV